MPSLALDTWQEEARDAFDELQAAHRAVGGGRPGRRYLTQQINYAYVTVLAARFQGFCRELHSEVAAVLGSGVNDLVLSILLEGSLTRNRKLDSGNATVGNLGTDFGRFGFPFWDIVDAAAHHNARRREELGRLMTWRNAIVHDDIDRKQARGELVPERITLRVCRRWDSQLDNLAVSIDAVLADVCESIGLPRPW